MVVHFETVTGAAQLSEIAVSHWLIPLANNGPDGSLFALHLDSAKQENREAI